jgi:hypothetical protein
MIYGQELQAQLQKSDKTNYFAAGKALGICHATAGSHIKL